MRGFDTTVRSLIQSWEAVTCQTMRWLCSALVGDDCWPAAGSDKPSSSPPSSPGEEDEESNEQRRRRLGPSVLVDAASLWRMQLQEFSLC